MTPRSYICCILFLTLATIGCSKNAAAPATVSGSVSYKGQTLKGGTIQFVTAEGVPYSGQIGPDGTYAIQDIPEGELVITVETESLNPAKKAAAGKDAARREKMTQPPPAGHSSATKADLATAYVKIPEKYSKAKTSPLTYTTTKGRQVHSIELVE